MPNHASITVTKGWIGAATFIYSRGILNYDIEIIDIPYVEPEESHVGTGGSSRLRTRTHNKLQIHKKVTVRVAFAGDIYERTVVVAQDVNITAENVEVTKTADQVKIKIKFGDMYFN
jgi:hypothetical protein